MKHLCLVLLSCLLLTTAPVAAQEYICGDVDGDGDGPDIEDLVHLVDWMVTGGPPPDTMIAANWAGCAGVNIYDLQVLIDYLFSDGRGYCEDTSECEAPIGGAISLDHVDWELFPGTIMSGADVTFNIRVTNDMAQKVKGASNGFRIYSPTGLTWYSTTGGTVGSWIDGFDLGVFINHFSCDGSGADTIGFTNSTLFSVGWPTDFDTVAFSIELLSVGGGYNEGQICIDTCWFPPSGDWMWASGYSPRTPSWDGPHCFDVITCPAPYDHDCDGIDDDWDNCLLLSNHDQADLDDDGLGDACDPVCCAVRGDINHTGNGQIDISDLVYMIDWMFRGGPPPPCMGEADINASGSVDIADLVALVNYMFIGDFLPPCN